MYRLRTLTAALACVAPLLLTACPTLEVYTAKSPTASFASYRTYIHGPPEKAPTGFASTALSAPVWKMVQADVDREMAAKGYKTVAAGADPDFFIRSGSGSQKVKRDEAAPVHSGAHFVGGDIASEYWEGTLIIDVFDARNNQLVWHGSSKRAIDPAAPVTPDSVARAVAAILLSFPAAGNGTVVAAPPPPGPSGAPPAVPSVAPSTAPHAPPPAR
jgi:hypothetical protein